MPEATSLPENAVLVASRQELREWLTLNHRQSTGIWLVTFKKKDLRHVCYDDVVEECLCFGWVDSKPRSLDDHRSMLWVAPRKPRSLWSAANKLRVEQLIRSGLMAPAGLEKVEAAKLGGQWNALNEVECLEVPEDLAAALQELPRRGEQLRCFPALGETRNLRMDPSGETPRNAGEASQGNGRTRRTERSGESVEGSPTLS